MALDGISGRTYQEAAIPGLTDTATNTTPVTDPTGVQNFPSLTPAQTAANAKAAGATLPTGSSSSPLGTAAGGALGKNEFLQLLVQEMTNQDPLKPADNTQFIAQLAQFSTLEQMQNMNDGMGKMQSSFNAAEARGLIGVPITSVSSSSGQEVDGTVDKVILNSDGSIQVDVNGTSVNLGDILSVGPGASASSPGTPATGSTPTSGAPLPGTVVPPTTGTGTTGTGTTGTGTTGTGTTGTGTTGTSSGSGP